MADSPPYPDYKAHSGDDTGVGPDRESITGAPRWVKVSGIIALVVVLLIAVMMLFGGGSHGPARHTSSGDAGGQTPPSSVTASGGVGGHTPLAGGNTA